MTIRANGLISATIVAAIVCAARAAQAQPAPSQESAAPPAASTSPAPSGAPTEAAQPAAPAPDVEHPAQPAAVRHAAPGSAARQAAPEAGARHDTRMPAARHESHAAVRHATRAQHPTAAPRPGMPRTLSDVHIEGEIPVPQVLFITARDQRRFMDFQHHRYLKTSLQLGDDTPFPTWVAVVNGSPVIPRKEHSR